VNPTPTLTCPEVRDVLDAFLDAELPAPMLLAVARHAAGCTTCDAEVRERTAVHEAVEQTLQADAEELDLSGIWPAVAAGASRIDRRRATVRRLRGAPVWGAAGLAIAASALFWFQGTGHPPEATRPAAVASRRPNDAVIDRFASEGAHVAFRRERKNGTMFIMVSSDEAVR
jgi:anti-sigma factor RsiW